MPAPTSAAAAEPAPPRTELQELQFKADQTTDEVRERSTALVLFFFFLFFKVIIVSLT